MVEAKVKDIMSGEVEGNVPEGVPGEVAAEAVAEGKKDLQELLDSIGSQATVIAISKVDTSTQVGYDRSLPRELNCFPMQHCLRVHIHKLSSGGASV
jgi:hypothetical protein